MSRLLTEYPLRIPPKTWHRGPEGSACKRISCPSFLSALLSARCVLAPRGLHHHTASLPQSCPKIRVLRSTICYVRMDWQGLSVKPHNKLTLCSWKCWEPHPSCHFCTLSGRKGKENFFCSDSAPLLRPAPPLSWLTCFLDSGFLTMWNTPDRMLHLSLSPP